MLRRIGIRLGGHGHGHQRGLPLERIYPGVEKYGWPEGLPKEKRASPMTYDPPHPGYAPSVFTFPTRYSISFPYPPFILPMWRGGFLLGFLLIVQDLIWGNPWVCWVHKDKKPGTSSHYWKGNNAGIPHHFWCYQDGWYMPNYSGSKRLVP